MRELRLGTWLVTAAALAAFGCDDTSGRRDGGHDTGVALLDSGPDRDSGGGTDAGRDSGGTPGSCGPAGDCDIANAASCGTGNACLLQGSTMDGWTTMCFSAGTGVDGTTCDPTMAGQCAEGFGCSDSEGVCRSWCCNVGDCAIGQICNIFAGAGPAGAEVGLCLLPDGCTLPPPQTGCDTGEGCNLTMAGETVCDSAGAATEGMPCEFRNSCVAGYACITTMAGEPSVCRQYCDMAAAMPCPDSFMCAGLTGAPAGVGVCIPMP